MSEPKQPMSTGAAIWHIAKFLIFLGLAIMFAYYLYLQLVVWPAEQKAEDKKTQAEYDALDRQMEAIDREYCSENPDDGSGFWERTCSKFAS